MSDFSVDIRKMLSISKHPNADKLEIGKVKGLEFQFVVQKGSYQVGDLVVYFPVDSVMTSKLMNLFELTFLSGRDKNRVKTIKLRNIISQGLVLPLEKFQENDLLCDAELGSDVTEALGIIKYEPIPVMSVGGNLLPLPHGLTQYDIEGYERYPEATAALMDQLCMISEKMEGTNVSVSVDTAGNLFVNQRNFTIEEIESKRKNVYWETARNSLAIDCAMECLRNTDGQEVTLYGELIGPGIQKNLYKCNHHGILIYDIKVDGTFLGFDDFAMMIMECKKLMEFDGEPLSFLAPVPFLLTKPVTLREWLDGRTIEEASNGISFFGDGDMLREGIVIRPMVEEYSEELQGRLILKKRSPEYLAKYGM